jgi:predicted acyltransferase
VLQPIAIAYLVAFLLVRFSPWIQAAAGAAILAANALIMAVVSAPGVPAGSYAETANIVRYVDLLALGRTYSPGNLGGVGGSILCIWFPIPTTILGMIIGGWLMSSRSSESKAKLIAGTGFASLALGYALSFVIPIIFKLVTVSFILVSAGWACLMLLIFYYAVDFRGLRQWTLPFVVIGSNSIFVYMFYDLVPLRRWVSIFTRAVAGHPGHLESLLTAIVVLGVEWLILFWMYRRKIFIKA